jgi:hypothetical protein
VYIPSYFRLQEVLPEKQFALWFPKYGDRLWTLFDVRVLWTLDMLRDYYGAAAMNNWETEKRWAARMQFRGWRPMDAGVGAALSQHKWGRAADVVFRDVSAEVVRQELRKDPDAERFQHITCIEAGVTWFHFDVRNHDRVRRGILEVHP